MYPDSLVISLKAVRIIIIIGELKQRRRQRQRKRHLKIYLYFICATSRLFRLAQLVVISRCYFAEDGKEMYQNVKRTCRAIVFAH